MRFLSEEKNNKLLEITGLTFLEPNINIEIFSVLFELIPSINELHTIEWIGNLIKVNTVFSLVLVEVWAHFYVELYCGLKMTRILRCLRKGWRWNSINKNQLEEGGNQWITKLAENQSYEEQFVTITNVFFYNQQYKSQGYKNI